VGVVTAAFVVAILAGNITQFTEHRDGFGLDTDAVRAIRLLFQPLLVISGARRDERRPHPEFPTPATRVIECRGNPAWRTGWERLRLGLPHGR
jgi:hypothetical protein